MKRLSLQYVLWCISLISMSLFAQRPISLPTLYQPQAFDVIHYDARLDLRNGLTKFISGRCAIKFVWVVNSSNENFYFHLRDLKVDSAFVGRLKVAPEFRKEQDIDYSYYQINFASVAAGDTQIVTIYYSGFMTAEKSQDPFGGVLLQDSVLFAIGVGLKNQYVSATQHWLPVYDHPSDKATYSIEFIVPTGFVIAANGTTVKLPAPDTLAADVFLTSSEFPIATYLLTFAMGRFKTTSVGSEYLPKSIDFVVYYLPQYEEAAIHSFKNFYHIFYAFQNRFGRYPFEKIGFVLVPFAQGAMEHQTMITFPQYTARELLRGKDTVNMTAAHEFAHQWFGDMATPIDFRDAWLSESFATFGESIFLETLFGYSEYLWRQLGQRNQYLNYTIGREGILSLYDFRRTPPSSNYPATIYNKGAVVVGMFRYLVGDDRFFALLRAFLDSSAYKSKSTQDFVSFCNKFLGEDYSWFFNQWIYDRGFPILEIMLSEFPRGEDSVDVLLEVTQVQEEGFGKYINLPLELNFKNSAGQYFDTVLVMQNTQQEFWVEGIPNFSTLEVNRGAKVVALLRAYVYSDVGESSINTHKGKIFQILISERNSIVLKLNAPQKDFHFRVFDLLGQVVSTGIINSSEGIATIKLSQLRNGFYLIQLSDGNVIQTEKFLIR